MEALSRLQAAEKDKTHPCFLKEIRVKLTREQALVTDLKQELANLWEEDEEQKAAWQSLEATLKDL